MSKEAVRRRPPTPPWVRGGRPALTGAWWARGLSLAERLSARGQPRPAADGDDVALRADRRAEMWCDAFPGDTADALALQCAGMGLEPSYVRDLLAEPAESLAARAVKPWWANEVERIVGQSHVLGSAPGGEILAADAAEPADAANPANPADPAADVPGWQRGFAQILRPFAADAVHRFRTAAAVYEDIADIPAICRDLDDVTTRRLISQAARILVLELNVFRVSGRLAGDTPEQRFRSFVRVCQDPVVLAELLDEYAVLARCLATTTEQTVAAYLEFLSRLAADRSVLQSELFDNDDPGLLRRLRFGLGDTHHEGRSVGIAEFAAGRRAVYKPRPVGVHRHFNDVVDWYAKRIPAEHTLATLKVLDRGAYGWVEHIEPRPCADEDAAERYFVRQGYLLALFYGLAAIDMHYENLIAVGDQPVPVDLETILHVDVPPATGSAFLDGDPAARAYDDSVARIGLLPTLLIAGGRAFDVGGMGGDRGAEMPFDVLDWDAPGTDEMHAARRPYVYPGTANRARLAGADLEPSDYLPHLLDGFRAGYRILAEHREELLGEHGLLAALRDDDIRCVVRPTREYLTLLSESSHPDVARDALDRDRVFGVLWASREADEGRLRLARHEVAQLWAGDVPLFTARADGRDLVAPDGSRCAGVLPESGLQRSERILRGLGEADLARQEWVIVGQAAGRTKRDIVRADRRTLSSEDAAQDAAKDAASAQPLTSRALRLARDIGDQLASLAVTADGPRIGWLGVGLVGEIYWAAGPLRTDLYNGYPGVGLFFAQLAAVTRDQRYRDLADRILRPLAEQVAADLSPSARRPFPGPDTPVGPFSGPSGLAYVYACCARLGLDFEGLDVAADIVVPLLDRLADQAEADTSHDVFGGAAGLLAVAESLVPHYGAPALAAAEACAQRLVATQIPFGGGAAWPGTGSRPLLGFAHGAAGIGWSLLRYAARTGDGPARAAARAAFAYERGEFRPHTQVWPDFRDAGEPPASDMHAWCHGAPGVGLARAALPAAERHDAADRDLQTVLDAMVGHGAYGNASLCHGDLGNLETLAAAARTGGRRRRHWTDRATAIVAELETRSPLCGTPDGVQTPGLMAGLAGIGHGLLRIAAPDVVAPVLLLAVDPDRR